VCRREDVGPDGLVLSKNVLGLKLDKRERGHVRDGYKRGWFLRWFDEFHPF
jgi:flagellar L-ring protein precursor FlgH